MNDLIIRLQTLTPLFLGGAHPDTTAELRAPSIKGQLRFWYRATDPDYRTHETRLFGSTDAGQSSILLTVRAETLTMQEAGETWPEVGLSYLGYGPVQYDKTAKAQKTQRPYIKPGSTFSIRCLFRPWLTDEDRRRVARALKAWNLFGGLGSRSRRGFGSLQAKQLGTEWPGPPSDLDTLEARCRECVDLVAPAASLPEHTAFSSQSVIKLAPIPNNPSGWRPALAWIGQQLARFRSCYGNKNKRFQPDHDLFYDVISGKDPGRCPERHVFGLPHNYFTPKYGRHKMEVTAERVTSHRPDGSEIVVSIERRGSPLFIRLHQLSDDRFVALFAFLPARLLPDNSRLVMKSDSGNTYRRVPDPDWSPIIDFLAQVENAAPGTRTITWPASAAV